MSLQQKDPAAHQPVGARQNKPVGARQNKPVGARQGNTAEQRVAQIRQQNAASLCALTEKSLSELVNVMNQETTLLRAGRYKDAAELSAKKAELAQTYVGLARAVQHENLRLNREAPKALEQLQSGHEKLATQMAENLKVLATAKNVTQNLLNDVAASVTKNNQPQTYGAGGKMSAPATPRASGIALNRAL
jgi:hypothetical protein